MTHKFIQWLILAALLLGVAAPNKTAASGSEIVGVRIFSNAEVQERIVLPDEAVVIDYGSFQWAVISKADLPTLDTMGVGYQVFKEPYQLKVGGKSFDPLQYQPEFNDSWNRSARNNGPALHLIQFLGPTKDAWLDSLNENEIEILQYIHPFTYVVWGTPESVGRAAQNWPVRWTGDFLPAYAVQPRNRSMSSTPVWFRAMTAPQAGLVQITQALINLGAVNLSNTSGFDPSFDLIRFILPGDRLQDAAAIPGVYSIQPVPTDGGDRGEMSNQVNVGNIDISNRAFPGYQAWLGHLGLSGNGVVIANVDSGIDETHPDLTNRIISCTGISCGDSTTTSNHGTHTAGIMAGDGTSQVLDTYGFLSGLGMAPGANLIEQVYNPTYAEENGMLTLMTDSHQNGAVISGNSWGPSNTPLGYDYDTRQVDIGVRDADPEAPGNQALTYVLSIMNGNGGTSSQGTPDEAKNIFSVGSTYMQTGSGSQLLNINDLSANTAHGPALDGRFIPHMVAPGCYVDSTYAGGTHGLMCGTSMASPSISGAAALFYEQYRSRFGQDPSPALVKAAFLPVGYDLAGNLDADDGILGHPFDAKQGWGRMDAAAVLDPAMEVLYYDQEILLNNTGEFWGMTLNQPIRELRAMLVWTDAPGHGEGGSASAWVNDLDLSITINEQTYYGNHFGDNGYSMIGGVPDFKNNTEGIFLQNLPSGEISVRVTAANIPGDGVPGIGDNTDQDFALVIYYSYGESDHHHFLPIIFR